MIQEGRKEGRTCRDEEASSSGKSGRGGAGGDAFSSQVRTVFSTQVLRLMLRPPSVYSRSIVAVVVVVLEALGSQSSLCEDR